MKGFCEIDADTLSKTCHVIVAGDIHGDYASFQSMHEYFNPRQDLMIFLGDYADRGAKGIEVIRGIWNLTREYPNRVYALKGNHEDYTEDGRATFTPCTLRDEATKKNGDWTNYFENELRPFIEELCLAVIIPDADMGPSRNIPSTNTAISFVRTLVILFPPIILGPSFLASPEKEFLKIYDFNQKEKYRYTTKTN